MAKLFDLLKTKKLILVICLGVFALLHFIAIIGAMTNGGFFNIVTALINMAIVLGLVGLGIFALLANKKELLKFLGVGTLSYCVVDASLNPGLFDFNDGLLITTEVFALLYVLVMVGILVIFVLSFLIDKLNQVKKFIPFALLGNVGLALVIFVLELVLTAQWNSQWYTYFNVIKLWFVLPALLFLIYLAVHEEAPVTECVEVKPVDEPAPVEEVVAEEVAPVEEPKVDEAPAEEEPKAEEVKTEEETTAEEAPLEEAKPEGLFSPLTGFITLFKIVTFPRCKVKSCNLTLHKSRDLTSCLSLRRTAKRGC
mgnify:CR=1 FL=1